MMASLKDDKGTLETRLYIIFNCKDEADRRCPQHLQGIFKMLSQVPYKTTANDGSQKVIMNDLENDYIRVCRAIHNHSFDIFAHRVNKRKDELSDIRRYIEQDQTHFTPPHRSTLVKFLGHVDAIIKNAANAQTTKQLPAIFIKLLLTVYSYWTKHNLLPKDSLVDENATLLVRADTWLAEDRFPASALGAEDHVVLDLGKQALYPDPVAPPSQTYRREILSSSPPRAPPPTTPYRYDLSSETLRVTLNAALAGTDYLSADWDEDRESFIQWLLKKLEVSEVDRPKPTVHAELAMIMAVAYDEIKHVLPYVGVSKISCIMCSHYIHAFNKVTKQKIVTKGSHGKAYPGWAWPTLPGRDEELVPAVLGQFRQQFFDDFKQYTDILRRLSDSSVGSGGPDWEIERTEDEIQDLIDATLPAQ